MFHTSKNTLQISYLKTTFVVLGLIISFLILCFWFGLIKTQDRQVFGVKDKKETIFTDRYLKILNREKIAIIEDNSPKKLKNIVVSKKWFYQEQKSKDLKDQRIEKDLGIDLHSGLEIFLIEKSSNSKILDLEPKQIDQTLRQVIGLSDNYNQELVGCNSQIWYQLSNNNSLPINYYYSLYDNNIFSIKNSEQTNPNYNKFKFDLKNICLN
jgi:hypothetical protein